MKVQSNWTWLLCRLHVSNVKLTHWCACDIRSVASHAKEYRALRLLIYHCHVRGEPENEASMFHSDLNKLRTYQVLLVNCRCSAVTRSIKLSCNATRTTSEMVASIQLPLNSALLPCRRLSFVDLGLSLNYCEGGKNPLPVCCTSLLYHTTATSSLISRLFTEWGSTSLVLKCSLRYCIFETQISKPSGQILQTYQSYPRLAGT